MKAGKSVWIVLAMSAAMLCAGQRAFAEDQPKPSLQELKSVKLSISVSNALVSGGAPGKRLRTQMELRLRNAGLQVDNSLAYPVLYLEITGLQVSGTTNYASYVSLQLSDAARVARNGEDVMATIWGPNQYVLYTVNNLESELFNNAIERTDEFINNWLQVNPRSPPATGAETFAAAALRILAPKQ